MFTEVERMYPLSEQQFIVHFCYGFMSEHIVRFY